ncbi:MAG: FecR family protein [Chloroflexota bacterium]
MRSNPEKTAWIILSSAFTTFCLLSTLIPAGLYWYVTNATEAFSPEVTSVRGTVLLDNPATDLATSLTDDEQAVSLGELFTVSTDDISQAILTFFDNSSLTMYSNTDILLEETRKPRFRFSNNPAQVFIKVDEGRVRATTSRSREDLSFDIETPHATVALGQGSFSIEVTAEQTQVTTRLGEATVLSNDRAIRLEQGQRAVVGVDQPLSNPLPAAQNLLENSDFSTDFEEAWEIYTIEPLEGVTTAVEVDTIQNRSVLRLSSQGEDNVHTETGVTQIINKDVRDFQSVRLFAEVRLVEQSLPGGGQLGSEFPIMLHVAYKDADNNDRDWFHGFYEVPPPENYIIYNQPDNSSERIAPLIWYPYESVNLLTALGPTKPVFIKSVRIYSSGWIYEAMVDNISLLVEE